MKEMLGNLADGQTEFYKAVRIVAFPVAEDLTYYGSRQWKSGNELYPLSNVYVSMFSRELLRSVCPL